MLDVDTLQYSRQLCCVQVPSHEIAKSLIEGRGLQNNKVIKECNR